MNTSVQKRWFLVIGLLIASLASPLGVSFAQTTNWIAYNDHAPNYTTPVNGWFTHPRATGYDMGESRGTGVRGGGYALRWTVATIIGARTWVDAHINGNGGPGVLTSNNFPASLGAGQAAWNAGDNLQGAVIGWDFITPALDGTFTIQS